MSVTLSLFAGAGWQFFDNNGVPLAGGLIYTYAAGTTTPQATYTSSTGGTAQANPIVLNSAGRVAVGEVWVSEGVSYKFVLKDSTGTTIGTYDNLNGTYVAGDLANTTDPALGDALVGFRQSDSSGNLTGAVGRTVHQKLQESVSVLDFGADPTGVADSYAAFQAAHDALVGGDPWRGGTIYVPKGSYTLSSTWVITKRVNIIGANMGQQPETAATLLSFPANTTGIRFHSSFSAPNGGSADNCLLSDINLYCTNKLSTGHGIHSSCPVLINRVVVRNFAQNGINIVASAGAGTGNANEWGIQDCAVITCGGNGLFVDGPDTNVGTATNFNASSNTGWGIYESSQFGNNYIGCHAAGNVAGSFYSDNDVSVFLGCYVEGGTGSNTTLDGAIVIGGVLGQVPAAAPDSAMISPYNGMSFNVGTGNSYTFYKNAVAKLILNGSDTLVIGDSTFNPVTTRVLGTWILNDGEFYSRCVSSGRELSITTSVGNIYRFHSDDGAANVLAGTISVNGNVCTYTSVSDRRLKENILPIENALDTISRLNPVSFTWKQNGAAGQGFIADELQSVIPDAVVGQPNATENVDVFDANGVKVGSEVKPSYQAVDTSVLIATLTKAVQELSAKVAALEK